MTQRRPHAPHFNPDHPERSYKVIDRGYTTPCWIWHSSVDVHGYGRMCINYKLHRAHRWFYAREHGETSMDLDHLCEQKRCVNPDHLEPVTREENSRRWWANNKDTYRRKRKGQKLNQDLADEIRKRRHAGERVKDLAWEFNINPHTVWEIANGRTWQP